MKNLLIKGDNLKALNYLLDKKGFLLKQTTVIEGLKGEEFEPSGNVEHDDTEKYNRFDLGLALGFGTTFPLSKSFFLLVETRGDFGLINLIDQISF